MTDHCSDLLARVPLNLKTSLANNHQIKPMECLPLLLHGIATSTNSAGESTSHNAITGMLTYEDSLIDCASVLGSVTMINLGSLKDLVI